MKNMRNSRAVSGINPIERLEHDHVPLNRLLDELRSRLAEAQAPRREVAEVYADFLDALGELREGLLLHFAQEDEGLFPLLLRDLPALSADIEAVQRSHDALCGMAARLTYAAQRGPEPFAEQLPQLAALLQRFEVEYTHHAQTERALLQSADRSLSPAQKEELSRALEGL